MVYCAAKLIENWNIFLPRSEEVADEELPNFDIISSLGLQEPESEAKNSGKKNPK